MKKLILIRGYPGSGKTTIGRALQNDDVGVFIDHNTILNFIAAIVGNDDGIYEEIHSLEKSMTKKLLSEADIAIVARGFSSKSRIEEYTSIAQEFSAKVYIFTLDADISILEKRVQADERKNDFNPTVSPEALRAWIQNNELEKLKDEIKIDASSPVNKIVDEIKKLLDS